MSKLKLSYIIPFYNGGKSVVALFDSIFSSGLQESDFEIVLVDDKSTDLDSVKVVNEYAMSHSNIRVIRHEKNKRQGGAKNTGILAAQGEYIALADQDDLIPSIGIANALEYALSTKVDMLACRYRNKYEDGSHTDMRWRVQDNYIGTGKEFCETHFDAGVCVCPWEYLYRREFLYEQNHPFAENVLLEASDWVEWHLIHAKCVAYCDELIYQWNVLDTSTSHQRTAKHAAAWVYLGYRKMMNSQSIRTISTKYADAIYQDGWNNVDGTMRRLWKTTDYKDFFPALGKDLLSALQQIKFSPTADFMLQHPRCTLIGLYIFGSPKRLVRNIRNTLKYGK